MTVEEKRNTSKDYPNDSHFTAESTTTYRNATDKEVNDALSYINKYFSRAMERLAK